MKGQIAFKPSDEMLAAIEKQRQPNETRPACVMRLLGKLLGVEVGDGGEDAQYLARKVCHLRLFDAEGGPFWARSVLDTGGDVLVVSQFTLLADCRQGRRPSFSRAAPPGDARLLYEAFVAHARALGVRS